MSLSECPFCGGEMDLGPEATNRCKSCGMHVFSCGNIPKFIDALERRLEEAEAKVARWIRVRDGLPPIGKIVETVSFLGVRKRAKWTGSNWETARGTRIQLLIEGWLFEPEMPEPPVW